MRVLLTGLLLLAVLAAVPAFHIEDLAAEGKGLTGYKEEGEGPTGYEEGEERLGYISIGSNGVTSLTFNATSIQVYLDIFSCTVPPAWCLTCRI
jgi:hypothetical protein